MRQFIYDFFQRGIIKFRIKIVKKLCHFEVKNPQLQFFNKDIHNLNNFKVINGYPGTWVPTSQTDGYPSFTTRTWVYHHQYTLWAKSYNNKQVNFRWKQDKFQGQLLAIHFLSKFNFQLQFNLNMIGAEICAQLHLVICEVRIFNSNIKIATFYILNNMIYVYAVMLQK